MALLTVAVAGTAMGSFLVYRSQRTQDLAQEQREALAWAHQAVLAFVAVKGRLPCPAASRAGDEDCTSSADSGWLPVSSLLASDGDRGFPAPAHLGMHYLMDRGAGVGTRDLAASGALYQPDFLPGDRPEGYRTDLAGSLDICARLEVSADVAESGVDAQGVAYGIGVTAQDVPDKISRRTRGEVYSSMRCGDALAALNTLAAATTWVDAATAIQHANIERGENNAQINTLGVVSDGFYLVDAIADLLNGIYNLVHNTTNMGVAASNPALVSYVPVHAEGMSKAMAGVVLSAVDTARNAGTLAIRAGQVQAFRDMSQDAIEQPVWQGAQDMLAMAHAVGVSAHLPANLATVAGVSP